MHAALALYRSAGFTEIPDYNGNRRAEIWMQLVLRGACATADERGRGR
jgi:hypothetical protein